jgi:hypothetical protein
MDRLALDSERANGISLRRLPTGCPSRLQPGAHVHDWRSKRGPPGRSQTADLTCRSVTGPRGAARSPRSRRDRRSRALPRELSKTNEVTDFELSDVATDTGRRTVLSKHPRTAGVQRATRIAFRWRHHMAVPQWPTRRQGCGNTPKTSRRSAWRHSSSNACRRPASRARTRRAAGACDG